MRGVITLLIAHVLSLQAAILPPPWADPEKNPCAAQPGGWLLVYWPQDGKCYRIFQRGYPCPETMELNPVQKNSEKTIAECRCPPQTARTSNSDVCYPINTQGPCEKGEYFAPNRLAQNSRKRIGHCIKAKACGRNEVFWPGSEECYTKHTKGPCPDGQLLALNKETQLGECQCSSTGPLSKYYWPPTKSCYQFYTKGPCREVGSLFLPGPSCGCHQGLSNYYSVTDQCYEIGSSGPCKLGHRFEIQPPKSKAGCVCKPEHVLWEDGHCYRLYTRGPCPLGEIIFGNNTCQPNPCPKGKLYLPEDGSCHRVGVKGPCPKGQLVLFEQSVRPSVEGISYRGMCGCSGPGKCKTEEEKEDTDLKIGGRNILNDIEESKPESNQFASDHRTPKEGVRKIKICEKTENPKVDDCFPLYSQGPCSVGEWLVPARQGRRDRQEHRFGKLESSSPSPFSPALLYDEDTRLRARCECKQGYTKSESGVGCRLPLVTLAKYLNGDDLFS